jgi:hypothetical protein
LMTFGPLLASLDDYLIHRCFLWPDDAPARGSNETQAAILRTFPAWVSVCW